VIGLPQGYSSRPPVPGDAVAVADLMAACVHTDGGAQGTSVEHVLDDWHGMDLSEEAVLVLDPDGGAAGYADVVNRGRMPPVPPAILGCGGRDSPGFAGVAGRRRAG
jgi:hypothetical protein